MIGRCLTRGEMAWVFAHSERLTANGYQPTVEACLSDYEFASIDPDWQALIVTDMRFQLDEQVGGK